LTCKAIIYYKLQFIGNYNISHDPEFMKKGTYEYLIYIYKMIYTVIRIGYLHILNLIPGYTPAVWYFFFLYSIYILQISSSWGCLQRFPSVLFFANSIYIHIKMFSSYVFSFILSYGVRPPLSDFYISCINLSFTCLLLL